MKTLEKIIDKLIDILLRMAVIIIFAFDLFIYSTPSILCFGIIAAAYLNGFFELYPISTWGITIILGWFGLLCECLGLKQFLLDVKNGGIR